MTMAGNPPGDDPAPKEPQPRTKPTTVPGTENVPGADVCAPDEVIRATTEVEALEVQAISGLGGFSVSTERVDSDMSMVATAASYEGPLPPPGYLKGYEEVVPGSGKEIISWVRKESEHRRRMDLAECEHRGQLEIDDAKHRRALETRAMDLGERALNSGITRANLGMYLSWPLMVMVVAAGSYLVHTGHDRSGTVIVTSGLGLIGGIYALNKFVKPRGQPDKLKDQGKGKDATKGEDGEG